MEGWKHAETQTVFYVSGNTATEKGFYVFWCLVQTLRPGPPSSA